MCQDLSIPEQFPWKKIACHVLLKSFQDFFEVFKVIFTYQDFGKIFKFCCKSYQDLACHGWVYQVSFHWESTKNSIKNYLNLLSSKSSNCTFSPKLYLFQCNCYDNKLTRSSWGHPIASFFPYLTTLTDHRRSFAHLFYVCFFLWKVRKIRKLQGKFIKITQLKRRIASQEQKLALRTFSETENFNELVKKSGSKRQTE